jgi:hypothetical protein
MRYLIFLLILPLAGCMTADKTVKVKNDSFSDQVTIVGSQVLAKKRGLVNVEKAKYYLRSWVNKDTKAVQHQLYFTVNYNSNEWRNFYKAAVKGGDQLDFTRISSDVNVNEYGTRYYETMGASIPHQYLIKNNEGFFVKWYAKNGTTRRTFVKKRQINKQLEAVQKQRANLTAKN